MPYVAPLILREEYQLCLDQQVLVVVQLVGDRSPHTADHLGQVGDRQLHSARDALAIHVGRTLPHPVSAGSEGQPGVGDDARVGERCAIEGLDHRLRRHSVRRSSYHRGGGCRRGGRRGRGGRILRCRSPAVPPVQAEHRSRHDPAAAEAIKRRRTVIPLRLDGWCGSNRSRLGEAEVQRRDNKQVEQGGRDQPPRMTMAIGCSISCPGIWPATINGMSASPVVRTVIMMGTTRSRAPRSTSSVPKGTPSNCSRC